MRYCSRGLLAFALHFNSVSLTRLEPSDFRNPKSLGELENKLKSHYAAIQDEIAPTPSRIEFPNTYPVMLRAWQDRRQTDSATQCSRLYSLPVIDGPALKLKVQFLCVLT